LYKVFYHNEKDVVSMVNLLYQEYLSLTDPVKEKSVTPIELYNMGKYFERNKDWTMAQACIEKASRNLGSKYKTDSLIRLSMIHKRQEQWSQAVGIWKDIVEDKSMFHLLPWIELAKYYEHKEKNFQTALEYSNRAIKLLSKRREKDIMLLNHRINRLKRKIGAPEI